MNNDVDWNLLAKYLFGECTEEEAERIRAWRERDPKRAALLRQFRRLLRTGKDPAPSGSWETDELWDQIRKETQPELGEKDRSVVPMESTVPPDAPPQSTRERCRASRGGGLAVRRRAFWMGLTAAFVLAAGLLWLHGSASDNSQEASAQAREVFTTERGERAKIRLSDGTRVELNVDSRLTLSETFGSDRRAVELKGEAFFEVVPDSTRPFLVHAGGTVTRVLGTAFGVRAYSEDKGAKIVVSEGRVALRPDNEQAGPEEKSPEDVMLTARQMARFLRTGERAIRRESDLSQHLAWMKGEIAFEGASFNKVTRVLERWYSLEIALKEGETSPSGHLNARFSGKSQDLEEVLNVVATAFRLEYERRGKKVIYRRLK